MVQDCSVIIGSISGCTDNGLRFKGYRRWKEGDKFIPFGMKGYKKLSNLFVDKKLSLLDKRNVRVVTADGEIVWVVGIRASDKFRIDEMTSDVVVMEVLDSNA